MKKSDPFQTDPFLQPNVMTMTVPALKSELNRLSVFIVGNPPKFTLQDKLLIAYADELLDKVAVHYRNFQNCSYAVLMKSKMKSVVTFRCTRYQVMAPGHPQSHWTNYKECGKILNKLNKESKKGSELFDMKTDYVLVKCLFTLSMDVWVFHIFHLPFICVVISHTFRIFIWVSKISALHSP